MATYESSMLRRYVRWPSPLFVSPDITVSEAINGVLYVIDGTIQDN